MILFSATRPGAADCIFPVVSAWRECNHSAELLVSGNALAMARRSNIIHTEFETPQMVSHADACNYVLNKLAPELVVAGLLGDWDQGLDLCMLRQAKMSGIKTIAVLDSWMNLSERMYGELGPCGEPFIPDKLAVPDTYAKEAMISIGFPEDRLAVTGQPAFDEVLKWQLPTKETARSLFSINSNELCIVFFSEPIRELRMDIGFDQYDSLRLLTEGLALAGITATILFKKHPVLEVGISKQFVSGISIIPVDNSTGLIDLMGVADVVAGISSTLLVKSYILDIPVMLLHPGSTDKVPSILSKQQYVRPVIHKGDVVHMLNNPEDYMSNKKLHFVGNSAHNIIKAIYNMTDKEIQYA